MTLVDRIVLGAAREATTLVDRIVLGAAREATMRLIWVRDADPRWEALMRFWVELGEVEHQATWMVN